MVSEPKAQAAADASPMTVVVRADGEPAAEVLGAVDAALAAVGSQDVVRLAIPEAHAARATIAELCESDPRVELMAGGEVQGPAGTLIELPVSARPEPRTLRAMVERVEAEGLACLEVVVPSRSRLLDRTATLLSLGKRAYAIGTGSGKRRIPGAEVGMGSRRASRSPKPPPKGELAHERAEHLRHRARSATYRARADRNMQRLARERLQTRHDRARVRLLEERLAAASPREWAGWRARQLAGLLAAIPRAIASAFKAVRTQLRRARRFAVDRWRSRRSPKPE
jgi:hypothetical protein